MAEQEKLQMEVKSLGDYIRQLEERIKLLEKENKFMEELNVQLMQQRGQ